MLLQFYHYHYLVGVWNVIHVSREHSSGLSEHLSSTFFS